MQSADICQHCGSDRTNSAWANCDCVRRNADIQSGEWVVIVLMICIFLPVIITAARG